jgi:hypothetical protein
MTKLVAAGNSLERDRFEIIFLSEESATIRVRALSAARGRANRTPREEPTEGAVIGQFSVEAIRSTTRRRFQRTAFPADTKGAAAQ